jgi:hypothetical protein
MSLSYPVLNGSQCVCCCNREFHITVTVCALRPNIRVSDNTSPVVYCPNLRGTKNTFTGLVMDYLQFVREF